MDKYLSFRQIFFRVKIREFKFFLKKMEFFLFFFFKLKLFFKVFFFSDNFFKNFFFGTVLSLKKKNLLNIFCTIYDHRLSTIFILNICSSFFLNLIIMNKPFFLNKAKKSKLYFLAKNVRFRRFSFNFEFDIFKKDRNCLILYFNVQKRIRQFRF